MLRPNVSVATIKILKAGHEDMAVVYTEEKKFSKDDVQSLFLSVGWVSGSTPLDFIRHS